MRIPVTLLLLIAWLCLGWSSCLWAQEDGVQASPDETPPSDTSEENGNANAQTTKATTQDDGLAKAEQGQIAAPQPAGETMQLGSPQSELRRARNSFEYGNYNDVIEHLEMGLAQDIFNTEQLVDVYRMLGLSYYITSETFKARQAFLSLLRLEPDYELNPLFIHPDIIDLFESVREDNQEELQRIVRERLGIQDDEDTNVETRSLRYNPYWVNFIPFGAGQFQNEDYVKGGLFLGFEAGLFALNITGYAMLRQTEGDDGYVATKDLSKAQAWRATQYAAFGALVLLAVGGVVDAVLNWDESEVLPVSGPSEQNAEGGMPGQTNGNQGMNNKAPMLGGWTFSF